MHFVILVVLIVAVCGRDLSDAEYYPAQPYGRYERHHISSPYEVTEARYEGNDPNRGNFENYRPGDLNNDRPVNNYEYNAELSNNDRNGRRHHFQDTDRHTHGTVRDMNINLAFQRQDPKRHRDEALNLPKQTFSINDEYSKKDDVTNNDNNRSLKSNLPTPEDGGMVFRNDDENDHDKRNNPIRPNNGNSYSSDVPNTGIISFLGHIDINNTNNNINSHQQVETQPDDSNNNQVGLKSGTVINEDQPPKSGVENKVTSNPFRNDPILKSNGTTEEKWIWGEADTPAVESTTVLTTIEDLDDRAAFEGAKCATGMARVQGKCVATD